METEPQTEHRSNRTIWIVVACLFVGLVVFVFVGLGRSEPSIRGRTLTDWIERMWIEPAGSPGHLEARQAILDIGTNAIPHLLYCLEGKPTPKEEVEEYLMTKFFTKTAVWLTGKKDYRRRPSYAVAGFKLLGTNAVPALPQLVELLDRPFGQTTGRDLEFVYPNTAYSMSFLGREGQLHLLARFKDTALWNRSQKAVHCVHALSSLEKFEPEVLEAISLLAARTNRETKAVSTIAIMNLEGSLDLKRSLLDWWFKNLSAVDDAVILRIFESTPELIPEFRDRIVALPSATLQTRLLTRPQAVPK